MNPDGDVDLGSHVPVHRPLNVMPGALSSGAASRTQARNG